MVILNTMTVYQLLEKSHNTKISSEPMVIFPLKVWKVVEERLEDLEMMESKTLRKKIAKARAEKKRYSLEQVKKTLKL